MTGTLHEHAPPSDGHEHGTGTSEHGPEYLRRSERARERARTGTSLTSTHGSPPLGGARVRWVRLACPRCRSSIEVLAGCRAWCTRCPGRPELEETAT